MSSTEFPSLYQTRLEYVVITFTFALAVLTSVIFGLLPAGERLMSIGREPTQPTFDPLQFAVFREGEHGRG